MEHCAGTFKSVESFYLPQSFSALHIIHNLAREREGEREVQHVWTTPDMTARLTISIRANENWEKTDSVVLQIGASGVKLQEYGNYLNWSLRRFPW